MKSNKAKLLLSIIMVGLLLGGCARQKSSPDLGNSPSAEAVPEQVNSVSDAQPDPGSEGPEIRIESLTEEISEVYPSSFGDNLYCVINEGYFQPRDGKLMRFSKSGIADTAFGEEGVFFAKGTISGILEFADKSLLVNTGKLYKLEKNGQIDGSFKADKAFESAGSDPRLRIRENAFLCEDRVMLSVFDSTRKEGEPDWDIVKLDRDGSIDATFDFSSDAVEDYVKSLYPDCRYLDFHYGLSFGSKFYVLLKLIGEAGDQLNHILLRFLNDGPIDRAFSPIELGKDGYYPKILFKHEGSLVIWNRRANPQLIMSYDVDGTPNSRFAAIDPADLKYDSSSLGKDYFDVILAPDNEIAIIGSHAYSIKEEARGLKISERQTKPVTGFPETIFVTKFVAIDRSSAFMQYRTTDDRIEQSILQIE